MRCMAGRSAAHPGGDPHPPTLRTAWMQKPARLTGQLEQARLSGLPGICFSVRRARPYFTTPQAMRGPPPPKGAG
jgi:hypothetical protein